MSFVDIDHLSPRQKISLFVMECRGQGQFASSDDDYVIQEWIEKCPDEEFLLDTLSEILPKYCEKKTKAGTNRSLKGIHKKILKKILEHQMMIATGDFSNGTESARGSSEKI